MMTGRVTQVGIIVILVAWCAAGVVRAGDVMPVPAVTQPDIVITDDLQAYSGPLGPDSPLYGLKLAFENLDEAFTPNQSERVMKQMDHAGLRLSEIKGLLAMNRSAEAERAFDAYSEKLNLTALDLSSMPVRTTGIANVYQQHVRHELELRDLLQANPDSTHLWRAYNSTLDLEEKFMEKAQVRIEKRTGQLNRITARVVQINERTEEQTQSRSVNREPTDTPPAQVGQDHGRAEKKAEKATPAITITETATPAPDDGSVKDKGKDGNGKGTK